MKLERLFRFMVPKDNKFFPLFVEASDNLVHTSNLLVSLVGETDVVKQLAYIEDIRAAEHAGDRITQQLLSELNGTFITPFDREDIHDLIVSMDDVVDYIFSASKRIHYYKLTSFPAEFVRITGLIHSAGKEIQHILHQVQTVNDFKNHTESCKRIEEMESEVDDIYQGYLAELFEQEPNAIDLIKKRDILTTLEKTIDKCDYVSHIFLTIIVKMG